MEKKNLKIDELSNVIIQEKDKIIIEDSNSFNQLLNLQYLIQKHSGLKELCKLKFLILKLLKKGMRL